MGRRDGDGRFWAQRVGVGVSALSLTTGVTMGEFLDPSKPQFSLLGSGNKHHGASCSTAVSYLGLVGNLPRGIPGSAPPGWLPLGVSRARLSTHTATS